MLVLWVLGSVGVQWGIPVSRYLLPKNERDEGEVTFGISLVK